MRVFLRPMISLIRVHIDINPKKGPKSTLETDMSVEEPDFTCVCGQESRHNPTCLVEPVQVICYAYQGSAHNCDFEIHQIRAQQNP